ncbi:MAG: DUF2344 domain-containing protein [Chloroflexi bacterium]|nr:DUF2344 domain-containing protein [Chloroflexota bacterium]
MTPVQRLRLCYAKTGDARYIGHLDAARFWERVFRRVDLPLAYSRGFNPQPRMQFASALPVGVEGERELMDVWLTQRIDPEVWLNRIRAHLPNGFALHGIEEVSLDAPSMQSQLHSATYEARFDAKLDPHELETRVQTLLAQNEILRPKRKRPHQMYDLRPLIHELSVSADAEGRLVLRMTLAAGAQGNARASEVIESLGLANMPHRVVRTDLHF